MSLRYPPGTIERLVGLFCRVNATKPPPTPSGQITSPIIGLLITKGMMRIQTTENEMAVDIPHELQVDKEKYYNLVDLLANEVTKILGVWEFAPDIRSALKKDGVIVRLEGETVIINPVKLTSRESQW